MRLGTGDVRPLTKCRSNGAPYKRRVDVEEDLKRLVALPREEIVAALKIRDRSSPHYLKSECIVYLIRQTRANNDERYFDELFRELMRRIDAALPRVAGERADGPENVHAAAARDHIAGKFIAKLVEDRSTPGSWLDYYEVMFADAIAGLRTTYMYRARRESARSEPIEADDETNEPSLAVERAVGSFDLKKELLSEDPIYRSRLVAAIRNLPDKHRRVIELTMMEMPIDSSDDSVMTIRKTIGVKSEKTVRNRRDEAYQLLRQALSIGDDND
ncbi:response regulator receiver [Sphingobium sp. TKS]|nr:response regulator receiver [Sphingobium sp. TKS]